MTETERPNFRLADNIVEHLEADGKLVQGSAAHGMRLSIVGLIESILDNTLGPKIAALESWVPKCKNCGRAITRMDLPAPEGPDMKGMHGWLHVSPSGVFCPPSLGEHGNRLQHTVEPEDSAVCRQWARLDQQRAKAEATVYELRKHNKDLEAASPGGPP